jgi:hypothetical protein
MSPLLTTALESLSAYRHVFPPGDPHAADNPVVWSHIKLTAAGKPYSVLSRVGDCGLDYSQRGNKLAHHVVLDPREQSVGGPAWPLTQPGFMQIEWDGEPRQIPTGRPTRPGSLPPAICTAWQEMTGDAGWAGVLAESFLANPERHAYIIFKPGMDLLPLLVEAIGLLPLERRWEVTFSTYFTSLPPGVVCNWRCVLADSPEAEQATRSSKAIQINLCKPLGTVRGGILVDSARTGVRPPEIHPQSRRSDEDEWSDEALLDELGEFAIDQPQIIGALNPHPGEYAVQERESRPPGMPPPPSKGQHPILTDAYGRESRPRWFHVTILAAICLLFGLAVVVSVGPGPFERIRNALIHGEAASKEIERNLDEDSRQSEIAVIPDLKKQQIQTTPPSEDGKFPDAEVQPEGREASSSDDQERPSNSGAERVANYDGRPVWKSRGANDMYAFDASLGKTLEVPVQNTRDLKWQIFSPVGFSPAYDVYHSPEDVWVLRGTLLQGTAKTKSPMFKVEKVLKPGFIALTIKPVDANAYAALKNTDAINWCMLSIEETGAPIRLFALQNSELKWNDGKFAKFVFEPQVPHSSNITHVPTIHFRSIAIRLSHQQEIFVFDKMASNDGQKSESFSSPKLNGLALRTLFAEFKLRLEFPQEGKQKQNAVPIPKDKGIPKLKFAGPSGAIGLALDAAFANAIPNQIKIVQERMAKSIPSVSIDSVKAQNELKPSEKEPRKHLDGVRTELVTALQEKEMVEENKKKELKELREKKPDDGSGIESLESTLRALRSAIKELKLVLKEFDALVLAPKQFSEFKTDLATAEVVSTTLYYEVDDPKNALSAPRDIELRFSKSSN